MLYNVIVSDKGLKENIFNKFKVVKMRYNYIRVRREVFETFRKVKMKYMLQQDLTKLSDTEFLQLLLENFQKQQEKD